MYYEVVKEYDAGVLEVYMVSKCFSCHQDSDLLIVLPNVDDYGRYYICEKCCQDAIFKFGQAKKQK